MPGFEPLTLRSLNYQAKTLPLSLLASDSHSVSLFLYSKFCLHFWHLNVFATGINFRLISYKKDLQCKAIFA